MPCLIWFGKTVLASAVITGLLYLGVREIMRYQQIIADDEREENHDEDGTEGEAK
jgi:hypothetical protein